MRGDTFHPQVVASHPCYEPAAVAAAPETDSLLVHVGLAGHETDGGADVRSLVRVIHRPADSLHLEGHLIFLIGLRLSLHRHELALALSPAAIVECEHDVTFFRKERRESGLRATLCAAGARAKNDGGKLVLGLEPLRQIEVARHACAVTEDSDRSHFDGVGQWSARTFAFGGLCDCAK